MRLLRYLLQFVTFKIDNQESQLHHISKDYCDKEHVILIMYRSFSSEYTNSFHKNTRHGK